MTKKTANNTESPFAKLLREAAALARKVAHGDLSVLPRLEKKLLGALALLHEAHGDALELAARVDFKRAELVKVLVRYLADDYPPTGAKVSAGNGDHTPKFWDEQTGTLRAKQGGERVYVGYAESSYGAHAETDVAGTLRATGGAIGGGSETLIVETVAGEAPAAVVEDSEGDDATEVSPVEEVAVPEAIEPAAAVVEEETVAAAAVGEVHCIQNTIVSRGFDAGAHGAGFAVETSYCLDTGKPHCVAYELPEDVHPEIAGTSRTAGIGSEMDLMVAYSTSGLSEGKAVVTREEAEAMPYEELRAAVLKARAERPRKHRVRRLTPLECSRLQGFPDWWLLVRDGLPGRNEISDEEAAERVKMYASVGIRMTVEEVKALMPDSALYEMIGNSMAAAVVGRVLNGVVREAANRRGDWFRPDAA